MAKNFTDIDDKIINKLPTFKFSKPGFSKDKNIQNRMKKLNLNNPNILKLTQIYIKKYQKI